MSERRSERRKEGLIDLFLFHRQKLSQDFGVGEDLLVDLGDQEKVVAMALKRETPLEPGYIINLRTRQLEKIKEGETCQRNIDGTPVHIEADGEPVFFSDQ
ncbi:hypothetical protein ACFL0Y_03215 [Patescibacteria group bacterium]